MPQLFAILFFFLLLPAFSAAATAVRSASEPVNASSELEAHDEFRLVSLFKNAAMVQYQGKQKLYRAGQSINKDIKLLSANTQSARFLIRGEEVELDLTNASSFAGSSDKITAEQDSNDGQSAKQAIILQGLNGMFQTTGYINGMAVRMLVDTGASAVAINEAVAKRLGLNYRTQGIRIPISTANGITEGWILTLKSVRVGTLELNQVESVVVGGPGSPDVLLGMTFLNRVKMENDGKVLKLIKKFN